MQRLVVVLLVVNLIRLSFVHGQERDPLDLSSLMPKEINSDNIFIDDDNYNWCSSVVQGEDRKL